MAAPLEMRSQWTPQEETRLIAVYQLVGPRSCAEMLGRSVQATRQKARRLKLARSRWKNWPTGRVTDSPLRDAIVGELADTRNRERIASWALDTLKQTIYHKSTPNLASIMESAELLGLEIQTREGWLDFARRVAARLPSPEQE
mgnify:CR=1 FL=1